MKKTVSIALMLLVLLSVFAFESEANNVNGTVEVVFNGNVNIRKEPWGEIVGVVPSGDVLETTGKVNHEDNSTWYLVNYNGNQSYIHSSMVEYTPNESYSEVVEVEGIVKVTHEYGAKARLAPWGTVIGFPVKGEEFETTLKKDDGEGHYWYKINRNGHEAYLSETVVEFTEKNTKQSYSKSSTPGKVTINYSVVNIRKSPWGDIIDQAYNGQSFKSIDKVTHTDGSKWYKIKFKNTYAYVHSGFVDFSSDVDSGTSSSSGEKGVLKVDYLLGLNVRLSPWGDIIGYAPNRESYNYIDIVTHDDGTQWCKIEFRGRNAYIYKPFVELLEEPVNKVIRVSYDGLNARDDIWGNVIKVLPDLSVWKYDKTAKDSDGITWYRIIDGSRRLWVIGSLVDVGEQRVTGTDISLSSKRFTGDKLEIYVKAKGTNRYYSKVALKKPDGTLVDIGDWSYYNKHYWQPPKSGEYEFVVYAKDVAASSVESTSTHKVKISAGSSKNTYKIDYFGMKLGEFAYEEVGRNVKWDNGWTDASKQEIYNAANPENSIPFDYDDGSSHRDTAVISDAVNFREVPGGKIIKVLYEDEEHVVYDYQGYGGYIYYKLKVDGKYGWIHGSYAELMTEKSATLPLGSFIKMTSTNYVKSGNSSNSSNVGVVREDDVCFLLDTSGSWAKIQTADLKGWVPRSRLVLTDEVSQQMYQFLDLSKSTKTDKNEINKVLVGKGILESKGKAFVDAAKKYNVNELYLVSHALLETGNGTSLLANGDYYNGVKVYNMYGIGAYDSNPISGGLKAAYENGWTTPERAIIGGAKWIGEEYIHNSDNQNTLYKMKWNYEDPSYQYATDIGWAKKQTGKMKDLYSQIQDYVLHFILPQFD